MGLIVNIIKLGWIKVVQLRIKILGLHFLGQKN